MPVECRCNQCGKTFYKAPHEVREGRGKFCSIGCSQAYAARNKVLCKCIICGKSFYKSPSEIKRGKGKYCSKSCKTICQNKKYSNEQIEILHDEFNSTGDYRKAAEKSGVKESYARTLLEHKQVVFKVTSDNKISVVSSNTVRKFAKSEDHIVRMNEFAKRMPLNLTEQQAKLYAMGYCDAKAWDKGLQSKIMYLIHRTYKLQRSKC